MRIRLLDDALANQIAAGEVVERPASVAKELLENALDAGATAIVVELAEGGLRRLRIADNGCGMERDDALLALRRHATSKLATSDDLVAIRTLGFRGEAIPSIASVSRFTLRTREPEAVGGTRVVVEGGGPPRVEDAGGPAGTEVQVEDLFFNVPARRKFLKKESTEASHVQEAVERLAVSHPEVAFRLVKDGRVAFDLPRHDTLLDRVRALFGKEAAGLTPVSVAGTPGLDGLVGDPRQARAAARHVYTYVNGRYVRDRVLLSAVQAACGSRVERGRHPFLVLRLRVPPGFVDVNVHPAKIEVRFADGQAVHRLVHRALLPVFEADPWRAPALEAVPARAYSLSAPEPATESAPVSEPGALPRRTYVLAAPEPEPAATVDAGLDAHRRRVFDVMERLAARRGLGQRAADTAASALPLPSGGQAPSFAAPRPVGLPADEAPRPALVEEAPPPATVGVVSGARPQEREDASPPGTAATGPGPASLGAGAAASLGPRPDPTSIPFARLRPLGWVADRYLLCAAADGVVGIDVAAARRRLAYDRLRRGAPSIPLASGAVVSLTPDEHRRFEAQRTALGAAGLDAEPFGGTTVALAALPAGVAEADAESFFRAALHADSTEALHALAADFAARAEGPLSAGATHALLAALAGLRHAPARPDPFVFALTQGELERRLA